MAGTADFGAIRLMARAILTFSKIGPHRVVLITIIPISVGTECPIRVRIGGH
jgi:hypothetical protein